jgi:hypothetical protein
MNKLFSLMTSIGLGAGLMYYYDPSRGRRRRALVRDRVVHLRNQSDDFLDKASRDMRNRARGVLAEASALLSDQSAPDWIIEERVRAELGRLSQFNGALRVRSDGGEITVSGPVLAAEVDQILSGIGKVRGVNGVNNQMDVYQDPAGISALQGKTVSFKTRRESNQQNWSPTTRLLAGVGGGLLAVYGRTRRGLVGSMLSLGGLGLMARGVANIELSRLVRTSEKRMMLDGQSGKASAETEFTQHAVEG